MAASSLDSSFQGREPEWHASSTPLSAASASATPTLNMVEEEEGAE